MATNGTTKKKKERKIEATMVLKYSFYYIYGSFNGTLTGGTTVPLSMKELRRAQGSPRSRGAKARGGCSDMPVTAMI